MEVLSSYPIYTQEHDELRDAVRRFVDKELRPHVDEWEDAGFFPDDVFRRCGELGFLGLHFPERWGGSGGDLTSGLVFVEELARCGCGGVPMAISVQTHMCTPALGEFGSDDLRERYLRPAIAGEKIGAIAITEPDAGSDVAGISTRAVRDGDSWVINGRKLYITNGIRADFLTLVAQTDPGSGHRGISLFIVDAKSPGVSVSRKLAKLGMLSSDTAEIALEDVVVPHANLIGTEPGQGFAQLMWQLQYERLSGAAGSLGAAQEILDQTITYARERRAFGRPIADHQVIARQARRRRDGARGRARVVLLRRLAHPAGRVPRRRDLDGEEVRGPGLEPTHRRVRPGARRRGLHGRVPRQSRLPRRPPLAHRRRHRRDHERGHRQAVGDLGLTAVLGTSPHA